MRNNSKHSRRSVICSFIGREQQQYLNQPSPETLARLSPAMRYIVGQESEDRSQNKELRTKYQEWV
jgi:hypothetical protein